MRLITILLACAPLNAAIYNIGPGQQYTTIGAAPWSSLAPGDTVNIFPQAAIVRQTASESTGKTLTLTGAGSIPYGSTVRFEGQTGTFPWTTCGPWGSGLYGTPMGGTSCPENTVTLNDPAPIGAGVTVYFTPPYFEKIILTAAGAESQRITVQGVADPLTGVLPVRDPHNATTGPNMAHYGTPIWHDDYGFVIFMKSADQTSWGSYITFKNLRLLGGRPNLTGFDSTNRPYTYAANAGIRFENADHVTVEGLEIFDNQNGMFGAHNPDTNPPFFINSLIVRNNHFYRNGQGSSSHQTYLEGNGITYENNWYDAPAVGTGCSQLKDRSRGTVIRYNLFYPSARIFDVVNAQNGHAQLIDNIVRSVPSGGFAAGATTLTFPSQDISGVHPGDRVGYIADPGGWGYEGTGLPLMPTVASVDAGNGTITLVPPGMPTPLGTTAAAYVPGRTYLSGEQVVYGGVVWTCGSSGCAGTTTPTLGPWYPMKIVIISRQLNPYMETFVYGNIVDLDQSLYAGSLGSIVHYGWDTSGGIDSVMERAGTLYFYNNTVLVRWDQRGAFAAWTVALFQMESDAETIEAHNNLFYVTNQTAEVSAPYFTLVGRAAYASSGATLGRVNAGNNQIVSSAGGGGANTCAGITRDGWTVCNPVYPVSATYSIAGLSTVMPAQLFPAGVTGRNYVLPGQSTAIGAAGPLPAAIAFNSLGADFTPTLEYGGGARRRLSDLGALYYRGSSSGGVLRGVRLRGVILK